MKAATDKAFDRLLAERRALAEASMRCPLLAAMRRPNDARQAVALTPAVSQQPPAAKQGLLDIRATLR